MILKLDIERVRTIDEVRDFMTGSEPVDFHLTDRRGAYDFVTRTLRRLNYAGLSKADKGVVRRFVAKVTGLSRAQSTRLIGQYQNTGHIRTDAAVRRARLSGGTPRLTSGCSPRSTRRWAGCVDRPRGG